MTKDELRNLLLDFADHLNSYKGFEEVRFDFMVVDYLDKTKQAGINTVLCEPESDVRSEATVGDGAAGQNVREGKVINMQERERQELYKKILKRGEPSA